MLGILDQKSDSSEIQEDLPKTGFPWVWIGFLFAFAFLVVEFLFLLPGVDETTMELVAFATAAAGMAYWLFCVYRIHKILNEISRKGYPVSPAEAVGKHFIPIINIIWLFQWPSEMSNYLNGRGRVQMMSGKLIGLLLLLSTLMRFVDGAVGLACTFGVTLYLTARLRRHVELIKGIAPDMLPPPPDRDLFGYRPEVRTEERSVATSPSGGIE